MSAGIGVDILEIARMQRVMDRRPSFLARVFTDEERAYCDARARPAEHYAARFAAREAVLKALGTGFSRGVGVRDVSVRNDESGRPIAVLTGRARQIADELGVQEVALSLSHTRDVAVANAVMVTEEVRPRVEERPDPERDLLASFRAARTVIDELERQQGTLMGSGATQELGVSELAEGAGEASQDVAGESPATDGPSDGSPVGDPVEEGPDTSEGEGVCNPS